ncbi:unnamed protein product, partial [Amoebophrya sp. A25]|eukprot:GSA25T00025685001.1
MMLFPKHFHVYLISRCWVCLSLYFRTVRGQDTNPLEEKVLSAKEKVLNILYENNLLVDNRNRKKNHAGSSASSSNAVATLKDVFHNHKEKKRRQRKNIKNGRLLQSESCNWDAFLQSDELLGWRACVRNHPQATRWEQARASQICICEQDVAAGLERFDCCTDSDLADICNENDSCVPATRDANCATATATQCIDTLCPSLCSSIEQASFACSTTCLNSWSPCGGYRKCPYTELKKFPYTCDGPPRTSEDVVASDSGTGGSGFRKPDIGGCCVRTDVSYPSAGNQWCPRFCDSSQVWWVQVIDEYECLCGGCPQTLSDFEAEWRQVVQGNLNQRFGLSVSREVGVKDRLEVLLQFATIEGPGGSERSKNATEAARTQMYALYDSIVGKVLDAQPYREAAVASDSVTASGISEAFVTEKVEAIEKVGTDLWSTYCCGAAPSVSGAFTKSNTEWSESSGHGTTCRLKSLSAVVGGLSGSGSSDGCAVQPVTTASPP